MSERNIPLEYDNLSIAEQKAMIGLSVQVLALAPELTKNILSTEVLISTVLNFTKDFAKVFKTAPGSAGYAPQS
jgi:hypothetical protein